MPGTPIQGRCCGTCEFYFASGCVWMPLRHPDWLREHTQMVEPDDGKRCGAWARKRPQRMEAAE
jgi:hypothetical protein